MGMDLIGVKPQFKDTSFVKYFEEQGIDIYQFGTEEFFGKLMKLEDEVRAKLMKAYRDTQEINKGIYFYNNIWHWHPLVDYIKDYTGEIKTEEEEAQWSSNELYEVKKDVADRVASTLKILLQKGHVARHQKSWEIMKAKALKENKPFIKDITFLIDKYTSGDDERFVSDGNALGFRIVYEQNENKFSEEDKEKFHSLMDSLNPMADYSFNEQNVKEFTVFCGESVGFRIA